MQVITSKKHLQVLVQKPNWKRESDKKIWTLNQQHTDILNWATFRCNRHGRQKLLNNHHETEHKTYRLKHIVHVGDWCAWLEGIHPQVGPIKRLNQPGTSRSRLCRHISSTAHQNRKSNISLLTYFIQQVYAQNYKIKNIKNWQIKQWKSDLLLPRILSKGGNFLETIGPLFSCKFCGNSNDKFLE